MANLRVGHFWRHMMQPNDKSGLVRPIGNRREAQTEAPVTWEWEREPEVTTDYADFPTVVSDVYGVIRNFQGSEADAERLLEKYSDDAAAWVLKQDREMRSVYDQHQGIEWPNQDSSFQVVEPREPGDSRDLILKYTMHGETEEQFRDEAWEETARSLENWGRPSARSLNRQNDYWRNER